MITKPTVYVAGPITLGDPFVNTGKALQVASQLQILGLIPYVPHWGALQQMYRPWSYEEWMTHDLTWLSKCDSLFRISGESSGADREVEYAKNNSLPVFYEDNDGLALIATWLRIQCCQ